MLRCYWLPIIKKITSIKRLHSVSKIEPLKNNDKLNKELRWNESIGIMPFIGSLDYQTSRKFYSEIGFNVEDGEKHCKVNINENLSFWLQNYTNKEWLDNSMIFLDVPDLEYLKRKLKQLEIENNYKNVRISESKKYNWGNEFFMHDPSGILWHFCEFRSNNE